MAWSMAMAIGMAAAAGTAAAQVHTGDVILQVDAWGRIRTAGTDDLGNLTPGLRAFTATFGQAPNFTNNPGFDCEPATFAPGTPVGFNIRAALRVWDDVGGDFDQVPAERVQVRLGPLGPVLTPLADQMVAGFTIAAGSDGKYHHHFGYTLLAPAGAGVYLLELEVMSGDGTLAASRPVFLVMNQNADGAMADRAALWVATHLVCPADVNDDRSVDLGDFFDFFNAFDQGLGMADVNADDVVDLGDFFAFFNGFDAGC